MYDLLLLKNNIIFCKFVIIVVRLSCFVFFYYILYIGRIIIYIPQDNQFSQVFVEIKAESLTASIFLKVLTYDISNSVSCRILHRVKQICHFSLLQMINP